MLWELMQPSVGGFDGDHEGMKIEESTVFDVIAVQRESNSTPTIVLLFKPTGKEISLTGAVLEAQYSIGQNYILFIAEGYPPEEALYIYFLNEKADRLDSIELSAEYTAGILKDLRIQQPNRMLFSFFADESWILEVLRKPIIDIWANKYPVKRKCPFAHRTYIQVRRT